MNMELNVWVVGGDLRQARLAELLARDGHQVHTYALGRAPAVGHGLVSAPDLGGVEQADLVILPLPVLRGEGLLNTPQEEMDLPLARVLDHLNPRQILCGGMVGPEAAALARARGLTLHDYFAREELAVANAVPTAEGAIQIALEELPITLHGARVLVIGYGRLGRLLAQRLSALGARVSVASRQFEHLAWAEAFGYGAEHTGQLAGWLCAYDLVINTAPSRVLGRAELEDLKEGALVIDLASKPGGVDLDAAAALGVQVVWALSLPGKVAPVTAGKCVKDTIYNILRELGV
jgi:dipicolinate synthase subunit A